MSYADEVRAALHEIEKEESAARRQADSKRATLLRDAGARMREHRIAGGMSALNASRRCGLTLEQYMACEDGEPKNRGDIISSLSSMEVPNSTACDGQEGA